MSVEPSSVKSEIPHATVMIRQESAQTKEFPFLPEYVKQNRTVALVFYAISSCICIVAATIVLLYKPEETMGTSELLLFMGFIIAAATILYMTARSLMIKAEQQQEKQYATYVVHEFLIAYPDLDSDLVIKALKDFAKTKPPSERQKASDISSLPHRIVSSITGKTGGKK